MLAQNFKTAVDLKITDEELTALVKVLGLLEREELVHTIIPDDTSTEEDETLKNIPNGFNMNYDGACGSVLCIGGWAAKFMNKVPDEYVALHRAYQVQDAVTPLTPLYWPSDEMDWDYITMPQAATVLRHFLVQGVVDWKLA